MTTTKNVNGKELKVISKLDAKKLSVPTAKAITKAVAKVVKAKEPKAIVFKSAKVSFHAPLLACNKADREENYSLSGAIRRLKKQVFENEVYCMIDTNVLLLGFEFDTILKYVSSKNIESQKFSVFAVGLAFNKYLKTVI